METKNKIGALLVLGGIALLGVYYFKKNKPNVAESQAKGLQALSNYYSTGVGANEETYIKGSGYVAPKVEGISFANLDYKNLTTKQEEDIKKAVGTISDPTQNILDQIGKNLENKDFGNLFPVVDWSTIKLDNIKLP